VKIRSVTLSDEDTPESVTVELTLKEAAVITNLLGTMSPVEADKIMSGSGPILSEIYACFTGSFFNRFFENGVDDA
jgi:hypothetical protein